MESGSRQLLIHTSTYFHRQWTWTPQNKPQNKTKVHGLSKTILHRIDQNSMTTKHILQFWDLVLWSALVRSCRVTSWHNKARNAILTTQIIHTQQNINPHHHFTICCNSHHKRCGCLWSWDGKVAFLF